MDDETAPPLAEIDYKEVARAIGWLDVMNDGELEFNAADWSQVNETGVVFLEGRKDDLLVDVLVRIVEVNVERDPDADLDWLDDADADDE